MKIKDFISKDLSIDNFEARPDQSWCILGKNRSGIDQFFKLLSGEIQTDQIERPDQIGILSFAAQQALFEEEIKKDDTDFIDCIDPGTPARQFLETPDAYNDLIRAFAMDKAMDKGYRQLSTGQSRKLLLLAQITRGITSLIIQAPYEGLDTAGCLELDIALAQCKKNKIQVIVTVHNQGDIPQWATHIGIIAKGTMALAGPRQGVLKTLAETLPRETSDFKVSVQEVVAGAAPQRHRKSQTLIRLKNGSAGYNGIPVFKNFDLNIHTGDHTLISGPNGCGKSTLLQMVIGDHPACYQNDLHIFNIKRGTGESIWDLKQKMGIVSPDLHRNYMVPGNALACVLSGLFDSIGLYTSYTAVDEKKAMAWLARIGLDSHAHIPFRQLSYADQRLVLIARALIKLPELLILDEPTQGLDQSNRDAILDFLEQVAKENLSTILYVSHRTDEFRDFFVSRISMGS